MDRAYTVEECYALCTNEPQCGGFVITKAEIDSDLMYDKSNIGGQASKGSCLLYREGCTSSGQDWLYDYYEMKDCQKNSKLFHY